jgi:ectoine hydroxylase-related dioxygenase (phytanoyl-CoA dioxygenase family)
MVFTARRKILPVEPRVSVMQQLAQDYKGNGFCVAKGLLSTDITTKALDDVHKLVCRQLGRFQAPDSFGEGLYIDMQRLLAESTDAYLCAARLGAKLASVNACLTHENVVAVVQLLGVEIPTISSEPVFHISSDKLQIPGGYFGFDAHQDWPSIQGSLDCVVAWLPLVEVTLDNYPLQVLPESHRLGLLKGEVTKNLLAVDKTLYDESKFTSVVASPGDVVFMSSWTLHRTGVENCSGFRFSISSRWENAAEKYFVERGYPCAYKKSVMRDLITPDFPSKKLVNSVFD